MKFVDSLPESNREGTGKRAPSPELVEMRNAPGTWAEIARYPKARRTSAVSRGNQTVRRYADIEYAVRTVGDESILFMRAVSQ